MLGYAHPRCIITIEGEEESGSGHYMEYLKGLKNRIGEIDLIICLDSGAGNYDTLWITSSLRGYIDGDITVKVLNEGVHSGEASGIVPDSFRVMRNILDRLENPYTGVVNE